MLSFPISDQEFVDLFTVQLFNILIVRMEILVDTLIAIAFPNFVTTHVLDVFTGHVLFHFPVRREVMPPEVTRDFIVVFLYFYLWSDLSSPVSIDAVFVPDPLVVCL
jgi:hypothetical protein